MRYLIRGNRSASNNGGSVDTSSSSDRGQVMLFLFVMSLVTTLWTVIQFHQANPITNLGIIRFDYAAQAFQVERDTVSGQKTQMIPILERKFQMEVQSLKGLYIQSNRNIEELLGENVKEKISGGNGLGRNFSDVNVIMQEEAISKMENGRSGMFVEYYACGSNTRVSSTRYLQNDIGWKGIRLYAAEGVYMFLRRKGTLQHFYEGTGFRICSKGETFMNSEGIVRDNNEVPSPLKLKDVSSNSTNGTRIGTRRRAPLLLEPSPVAMIPEITRNTSSNVVESAVKSSPQKCHPSNIQCFSFFTLLNIFKRYEVNFLVIHAPESISGIKNTVFSLLAHTPLIQVQVLSIISSNSIELPEDIKTFMESRSYEYKTVPLHPPPKISLLNKGKKLIAGLTNEKIQRPKVSKQHLFILSTLKSFSVEHLNSYLKRF